MLYTQSLGGGSRRILSLRPHPGLHRIPMPVYLIRFCLKRKKGLLRNTYQLYCIQYISITLQTDSIFMCITQLLQKSHRRPQKGQRGHCENTGHWLLQNGEQWGELVPLTSVPVTSAFLHTHEYVMANLTRTVSERLILSMCSLPHSAENTSWSVPKGKCWSKHVTFVAISTPELTVVNGFTQSPTKQNRSCDFNSCLNSMIALPPLSSSLDAGIEPILRHLIMKRHPL